MANHRKQKYLSPDVNGQTLRTSLGTAEHIKMHKIDPAPKLLTQTDRQFLNFCCQIIKTGGEQKNYQTANALNTADTGLNGASAESK
jgi:hypothetical protein